MENKIISSEYIYIYKRKRVEKKVIVLGGVANTERKNRDSGRVMSRKGICYTLPAHISVEKPLVIRKIKYGENKILGNG